MPDTIKLGDKGKFVKATKYLSGFSDIKQASEDFDETFSEYIKNWQRVNNLEQDGVIGDKSWETLADKAPTVSTSKNRKSAATCALQELLDCEVDGICGPKTKAAIAAYQAANDLVADGICGKKTWRMLLTGKKDEDIVPSGADNAVQPPNFKQYDSRWASKMYSNHGDKSQTMKSSACGPTSMADIVAQWWDVNVTPWDLAQLSMQWGTRTYDSGTSSTFFKKIAAQYGASKYITTSSIQSAIACLNAGGYVVVCFGKGTKGKSSYQKWTKGGHYCCIWKYDGKYFYINDPASAKAVRAKGTYDEVLDARKGFYCFYK